MKTWIKAKWQKFKTWAISILIGLGLIVGTAMAGSKDFSWSNPTFNEDGTAFDAATELAETRIYCGEDPAIFVPEVPGVAQVLTPTVVAAGSIESVTHQFLVGSYSCFATSFSTYGYESAPSNVVTFEITPTVAPNPPELN